MITTIGRKVYDKDTAAVIHTLSSGEFGDPAGYEERLYKTENGHFFVYGLGGPESTYPTEAIEAISKKDAISRFGKM